MFIDPESGLQYFMWGVGSSPGHDNIIAFTHTDQECVETGETDTDLFEGHAYYIVVKVCEYRICLGYIIYCLTKCGLSPLIYVTRHTHFNT